MSARTIHKVYWDFEKEELWLNEMSAKGLNLVHHRWGGYTFEMGTPGEWIYRIELLPKDAHKPDSREYLEFMSMAGVQTVATSSRWAYFRRPAADGPFEIFSDLDSRISHYERVRTMSASVMAALVPLITVNIVNAGRGELSPAFVIPLAAVYLVLFAALGTQIARLSRRLRELRDRKRVYE